jgi:catechol 2,3-dioxygenase-like lactoylglutathione lyase family enzyme
MTMTAVLRLETNAVSGMDEKLEATRRFYCDILGGREIASPEGALWFLVRGVLVETGDQQSGLVSATEVRVTDPEGVAARCWNAGYTVLVDDRDTSCTTFVLLDPFGVRIDLATS